MSTPSLFEELDLTPVRKALQKLMDEGALAIHWHDPESEFSSVLNELDLSLDIHRVSDEGFLRLKMKLTGVPKRPFLIYTQGQEPPAAEDPFLNIKCYAKPFRADRASLQLVELGLASRLDLVRWVELRKRLLASSARKAKFKALLDPRDSEADLDRKAICLLAKASTAEPREAMLAVLDSLETLDSEPPFWKEITNYGLAEAFWSMAGSRFSIPEEARTFRSFLLRLFATDLRRSCHSKSLGSSVTSLALPSLQEAGVFLSHWRDSSSRCASYARLSKQAAKALNVSQAIGSCSLDKLAASETFETIDQRILVGIRDELLASLTDSRRGELKDLIQHRLASHWPRQAPGSVLSACYEGLDEAIRLMELVNQFEAELPGIAPKDLASSYIARWHKIDTAYRRFCVRAQKATDGNIEVLKPAATRIEDLYTVGFLAKLGARWSEALDAGLVGNWKIPNVVGQRDFFRLHVQNALNDGLKRIFVVISDALRFEAGAELTERLKLFRYSPTIEPMLSTLPSMTALGMAALLPHKQLSLGSTGQVLADGASTTGFEARHSILAAQGGLAIRADELKVMKRDDGRALIKDARVVYIYHDIIDAVGDKASSEGRTFSAVDEALDDLAQLVRRIIDQLNGSTVIVTADHGFLYTESSPTEIDKSSLGGKIESALIAKKRYVIGKGLPKSGPFHRSNLEVTAGLDPEWEGIYPRSTQRFHLAGGAQYVHGGPMLQEVVVPLIVVKELVGESAKGTESRPVGISLATNVMRVTTNQQTWRFIQVDKAGGRLKPLKATVGIFDGDRPVSDLQPVVFDSETDVISDRERRVRLTLASETFDRRRSYRLVVRNADDGTEAFSAPLTLDIAFTNEF